MANAESLLERHRPSASPVLMTGIQAVGRLLAEQHDRDTRDGMSAASFVSGYPGSPLGGLDRALATVPELRTRFGMHLVPGQNEELAATAVWGSQLELPGQKRTVDAVTGVWFAKAPGLDRAGDAIRHANMLGAHPRGGVLALVGDDPGAKSSTLPSATERTIAALGMPVLFPRNAEELITLGLYGVALSRASGHWVAMKIVTDVADGLWSVERDFTTLSITLPALRWQGELWSYRQHTFALPPHNALAEQDLVGPRSAMVDAFVAANPVDEVEGDHQNGWLGIVSAGKTYDDVRQTLVDLGIDDPARMGVRMLRLGVISPVSRDRILAFARGLETLLVVEEKGPFVETQVRALLYDVSDRPRVLGVRDSAGNSLIPVDGELTAARLAGPLHRVVSTRLTIEPLAAPRQLLPMLGTARSPYFCSGCPHNRSTETPEGSIVGGGIGCHAMVAMTPHRASTVTGLTQMGGEGAQWIGAAAFTDAPHLFQNLGDGTYFHSGQLAIQACLAAGVNITFKILFNSAVAMTGGQDATGALSVPELTRKLAAEGVGTIVVCADDPKKYGRAAKFAPGVQLRSRDDLDAAQRLLREMDGVTVLIYDQHCAAEARRMRKRGTLPYRSTRVIINERVCEGCGDCGKKSNCLSVEPVLTEFGRKTRIDQSSCNTDYTCLDGDCPAFITVEAGPLPVNRSTPEPPSLRPSPQPAVSGEWNIFLTGIGGTGIVTVNQVLAAAAIHSGLAAHGLDQTGLSQKAGPVVSHLRLTKPGAILATRIGPAQADTYLAFDMLVGADSRNVAVADPARTRAVVSTSNTPTGAMVVDPTHPSFDGDALLDRIRATTATCVEVDSQAAAHALLGDDVFANMILLGAAIQSGALPLAPEAVEWAIGLNGVAVDANVAAFRWGRAAVDDRASFASAVGQRRELPLRKVDLGHTPLEGETRRLTEARAGELRAHSGRRVARDYVDEVVRAWEAEAVIGDRHEYSAAVATGLFHVLAYKDEYEVARLLTDRGAIEAALAEVPGARRVRFKLHPPVLRSLGLRRKVAVGTAWRPLLHALKYGRFLRGRWLDPFGHTHVRRAERQLASDHSHLIARLTSELSAENYDTHAAGAAAAELVRGYEQVKMQSLQAYRDRLNALEFAPAVRGGRESCSS